MDMSAPDSILHTIRCIFFCHWNWFLYLIVALVCFFFFSNFDSVMQIAIRRGLRIVKKSPEIFISLLFPLSPILSPLSSTFFFPLSLCSGKQFPQGNLNSCAPWIQLTGRKSPNRSNLICLEETGKTAFKRGASLKASFINDVCLHHFTVLSASPCLLLRLMCYQSWEK